jgi:hypothetical protein
MLSQLDNIIFPDRCEVLEIAPQRFVYPIYKNGSSSLYNSGFRVLDITELPNLDTVEIFVRDPFDRFQSGITTWIQHNSPTYDRATLLWVANNHLFLNRHFCPQFHWLVNLRRFTAAKIKINPISELSSITTLHKNANENKIQPGELFSPKAQFYLQIDKVLTETLIGQTVELAEIMQAIKDRYPTVYQEVIQRSINLGNILLCNVLV